MDPYLERHWRDVHHNFITFVQGELNARLPSDLIARVEERVLVSAPEEAPRSIYPDVRVVEQHWPTNGSQHPEGGVAVAERCLLNETDEKATEGYVEILEAGSGHRLVTVIEVLSLTNKTPGENADAYLRKRAELKQGQVNVVEIDLLRGGKRVLMSAAHVLPTKFQTPYRACLWRYWRPKLVEACRIPLRERLPALPIPLREKDADVLLDLQSVVDKCYANGRFDRIDYSTEPDPPLAPDDAAWADALLREKGRR
jgi:hypothetical protein